MTTHCHGTSLRLALTYQPQCVSARRLSGEERKQVDVATECDAAVVATVQPLKRQRHHTNEPTALVGFGPLSRNPRDTTSRTNAEMFSRRHARSNKTRARLIVARSSNDRDPCPRATAIACS
jgi:hypothetical protein